MKRQVSRTKEEEKEARKKRPNKKIIAKTIAPKTSRAARKTTLRFKEIESESELVKIATKSSMFIPFKQGAFDERFKSIIKQPKFKKSEITKTSETSAIRVKSTKPRIKLPITGPTHSEWPHFNKAEPRFDDIIEEISVKDAALVLKAKISFSSRTPRTVKVEMLSPQSKKIAYETETIRVKEIKIKKLPTGKKIMADLKAKAKQRQQLEEAELGIFDLLFEEPEEKKHNFKSILKVAPVRPVCIIAEKAGDENYISALQALCREIYRIKVGGLPEAKMISVSKREAEERAEAEGHITIIDDSNGRFFDYSKIRSIEMGDGGLEKVIKMDKLRERIMELPSQGFGFLIFYVKKEVAPVLLSKLAPLSYVIPKLFYVKLRDLSHEEKELVSTVTWGLVEPPIISSSFDELFKSCENAFYDRLERIANDLKYYRYVKESLEDEGKGGAESFLHYATKVLVVRHLVKKEKVSIEEIETEERIDIGVPDIFIKTRDLAIEVETLYHTAAVPLRKLIKTLDKYRDSKYELRIVLPNLQLLAFIRELRRLERDKGINVEFYSLDVNKAELVPLEKFREKILKLSIVSMQRRFS